MIWVNGVLCVVAILEAAWAARLLRQSRRDRRAAVASLVDELLRGGRRGY